MLVPGAAARLFPMLLVAPTDLRPPRGLSCWTCPLCVPVGDGPPARSPHASFARSGRSRSPARPCRRPPAPRQFLPVSSTPVVRRHHRPPAPRPGPQPHKQTLNNVRTRPVVQCLPMGRCVYPQLGLLVWAVHPIRRHCTRSDRVQRHVRGAAPRNGCSAPCVVEALDVVGLIAQRCYAT